MKMHRLISIGIILSVSYVFGTELPKEIGFTLPEAVAHKTEENYGRTLQCFRLVAHPHAPNYWGRDLPSLIIFPLSKEEYQEAISDFKNKSESEIEKEILSQFSSEPSVTDTSVKVSRMSYGMVNGYSVYSISTFPALEATSRMYSVWFEMGETYWMGAGVSLRDNDDLKIVEAIIASLEPIQTRDDNSK